MITGLSYNLTSQISSLSRNNTAYAWTQHFNVDRPDTVNGLNQVTSVGALSFGYDGRGNLTTSGSTFDEGRHDSRVPLRILKMIDLSCRGIGANLVSPVLVILCWPNCLSAQETQHYAYNARGELRSVARSGGTNDGFKSAYTLDNAANRSRVVARDVRVWLGAGMSIASQDGRFQLVMQTDGNLVLYGPTGPLCWTSSNGPGRTMLFQSDGNLVVYGPSGWVWAIHQQNPGAEMTLQNDGNLVIRAEDGRIVGQSGTGGH